MEQRESFLSQVSVQRKDANLGHQAGGLKPLGQSGKIVHAKFDLGFDGHRLG